MPVCGVLWGAGIDETYSWDREQVEGGKFSAQGNADRGRIRHPADLGGWPRHRNLFLGVFEEDFGLAYSPNKPGLKEVLIFKKSGAA